MVGLLASRRILAHLSRARSWMVAVALVALVAGVPATPVHAATTSRLIDNAAVAGLATPFDIRADEQYVFSVGIVDRVSPTTVTLRFDDGVIETYTVNAATTIQSQNGDALRLADLEVGEMVIVLTVENDSMAVTIVSGGDEGFHDAGPADIRGHDERECAACDAHSPEASDDGAPD